MNINVTAPNMIPLAVNPPTDSARRDKLLREVIPPTKELSPYAKESQVGSQKDNFKSSTQPPATQQQESNKVEAANINDDLRIPDDPNDGQSGSQQDSSQSDAKQQNPNAGNQLSEQEQAKVRELEKRSLEVETHEQQHAAAGGQYASAPSYTYERGPDGKNYKVDGEVSIDVAPIANDPQATIDKMRQVKRAAQAPSQMSAADRQVASQAASQLAAAQRELAAQKREQIEGSQESDDEAQATQTAGQLQAFPEPEKKSSTDSEFEPFTPFELEPKNSQETFERNYAAIKESMDERISTIQNRYQNSYANLEIARPNLSITA
ncbi:catalase [Alginatibacterium sediminis]|uniref:Catalase n=1 Tax=Alginatibacterium sediminis TaxID=2164068 RepID=A0A420ELB7_9ALTE|nr:putative metalloprotease CJM1_0395 family protein [Alginatibacterium sediminis]RKF21473.1 catalase [Alginatibacterium sediminis]